MPKRDYFQMRYNDAVANKDTRRIAYYGTRLADLDGVSKPKSNPAVEYIDKALSKLDRGIVATPETDTALERFAEANHGCNDFLLMQMSKNYGYKLAMEEIKNRLTEES